MPNGIHVETEEVEINRTETKKTTKYFCEEDDCTEFTDSTDPKADSDIPTGVDVAHNINYVSLNPAIGRPVLGEAEFLQEVGVYVCNDHISRSGQLLLDKIKKKMEERN